MIFGPSFLGKLPEFWQTIKSIFEQSFTILAAFVIPLEFNVRNVLENPK